MTKKQKGTKSLSKTNISNNITFFRGLVITPLWLLNILGRLITQLISLPLIVFRFLYKMLKGVSKYLYINFSKVSAKISKIKLPINSFKNKKIKNHSYLKKNSFALATSSKISNIRKNKKKSQSFFEKIYQKSKDLIFNLVPKPFRLVVVLILIFSMIFGYSISLINIAKELPSPEKLSQLDSPATTEILDRNGKLLYRLYEGKNRTPVKISKLPPLLVDATIAVEDQNFYSHPGFDIFGIIRAAKSYLENSEVQGGSTITQQLIKNTMLSSERTFDRKIKEIILAFWAERVFTKQEILQMYFNEVPYGGPAWGIAAAARTYFDKDVSQLTLAESAYLAGLPASPTTYSPYGPNPELGKTRQKEVLRRMVEDGYITQKEANVAYNEKLNIKSPISQINAPHFVMYVRQLLVDKYGEKTVSQGGLKVTTSLDLDIQTMAQDVVSEEVDKLAPLSVSNGAAMITDPKTGQILAMVGSKDFFDQQVGNFNVTTALRQPGSSIKPITYATGFKKGYSPGSVLLDTPISFKNPWETYTPVNYDGRFHGPVTIRTALGSSYNIPAVKMLSLVGIPEMLQTSKDMGITTFTSPDRYGLSLALGGGEVRMTDMMTVYGTFSQNGTRHDLTPILKIVDKNGNTIEEHFDNNGRKVISSSVAYLISDVLSDNKARTPAFGSNSQLVIPGHTVAVKTGTTNDKRDNLAYGYTPEFVVGAWVGNNDNSPMNQAITSGVTGATPIWNRIMTALIQDRPDISFVKPADVTIGMTDGNRDLIITGIPQKSAIRLAKREQKQNIPNPQKEIITFTDPFSTFTNDPNAAGNIPQNR